jgi:hypothetical protein
MSLYAYTIASIVAIVGFIIANYCYGLPWHASCGLILSLIGCIRGLVD